jgi:hypothetical protein
MRRGPDPVTVTIVGGHWRSPAEFKVGVGGIRWINNSNSPHGYVKQGASMATHASTVAARRPRRHRRRSGQRIRWYVFNLDTSPNWHNFHPHAMRWKFGGQNIDIRSIGPAESFVVESEIPPVLLLTADEEKAQDPAHRRPGRRCAG